MKMMKLRTASEAFRPPSWLGPMVSWALSDLRARGASIPMATAARHTRGSEGSSLN